MMAATTTTMHTVIADATAAITAIFTISPLAIPPSAKNARNTNYGDMIWNRKQMRQNGQNEKLPH